MMTIRTMDTFTNFYPGKANEDTEALVRQRLCFPDQALPRTFRTEEGVTVTQQLKGIDPKGDAGAKKLPLGSMPWAVIAEASLGMGEGMVKYGAHNWRESGGVEVMTYVEAAKRHLLAFVLGEDIDPFSGIHHISKAITSLMVVRDAQINNCATDNRPPAVDPAFLEMLTASWGGVREKALAAKAAA